MPERRVAVARELTKFYEEIVRGSAEEVAGRFSEPPKGEVVVVLGPWEDAGAAAAGPSDEVAAAEAVASLVAEGVSRRRAAELVSRLTGVSRNALYGRSL